MSDRSRRRTLLLVASGGASCALVACSLLFAPDDALTSGDGTGTGGGARVDVSSDTGSSTNGDAARSDGGGLSFCQRAPMGVKLCDEFERETLVGPWSSSRIEADSGSSLAIERDDGGGFLRSTIGATTGVARAYLRRLESSPVTKRVRFAYRIRLDRLPSPSSQSMVIGLGSGAVTRNIIGFTLTSGTPQVYEQSLATSGATTGYVGTPTPAFELTAGRFYGVDMTVQVDVTPAKITLVIDGTTVLAKEAALPILPAAFSQFEAGLAYAMPSPDLSIDIDDVLIEAD